MIAPERLPIDLGVVALRISDQVRHPDQAKTWTTVRTVMGDVPKHVDVAQGVSLTAVERERTRWDTQRLHGQRIAPIATERVVMYLDLYRDTFALSRRGRKMMMFDQPDVGNTSRGVEAKAAEHSLRRGRALLIDQKIQVVHRPQLR